MYTSKIIDVTKTSKENGDHYTKVVFEKPDGKRFDYEIWFHKKNNSAGIARNNIDYAGAWFEGKTLSDYDGVFELSMASIRVLRKAGFRVPKEFEPEKQKV